MHSRAKELIETLNLLPHPEGGYYREVYRSPQKVFLETRSRSSITAIYYLLCADEISKLHKVSSDEVWQFVEGDPLDLINLNSDLKSYEISTLGSFTEKLQPILIIPANNWQAAHTTGSYSLVSCFVAPGFEFEDFTMMHGSEETAQKVKINHPSLQKFI